MSQENVEIVKQLMDAHDRRDLDDFDELTTPDFEWVPAMAVSLGTDVYRRREGIEAYFRDSGETWEDLRDVRSMSEFRDLGDRVLVLSRFAGRGRSSGVSVDAPLGVRCEAGSANTRHESFIMDASVSVKTAETAETNEELTSHRSRWSRTPGGQCA
ncbi:MAG TPA: nuclear transport factor 2 family protein [Solirubrobacteraceae bacterium]|jgi:ketosteroid isomerase-like protein